MAMEARICEEEPFVMLKGAASLPSVSESGRVLASAMVAGSANDTGNKRICKVCHSGRVFWAYIDSTADDCFEWLCDQLDLDPTETALIVTDSNGDKLSLSTSSELRHAVKDFSRMWSNDPDEPMRVEVQLNENMRGSLLAQSFVVVDASEAVAGTEFVDSIVSVDAGILAGFEPPEPADAARNSLNKSNLSNGAAAEKMFDRVSNDLAGSISPMVLVGLRNAVVQSWFEKVFEHSNLSPSALCNSYEALSKTPTCEHDDQIDRDVPRTFASMVPAGKENEYNERLRRVLRAIAQVISPGYVQGMNFICGFMLTSSMAKMQEADVFALVVGLMGEGANRANSMVKDWDAPAMASHDNSKYGFAGLYDVQMPKLNRLVYQVDMLLPSIAPRLGLHLKSIGIDTSIIFLPGWTLTMFTNKLTPTRAGPIFNYIMQNGYNGLVRLCLASLVAFEDVLCSCDFELCLVQLTQKMWQDNSDAGNLVLGALERFTVTDDEIYGLGLEYTTGLKSSDCRTGKELSASLRRGRHVKGSIPTTSAKDVDYPSHNRQLSRDVPTNHLDVSNRCGSVNLSSNQDSDESWTITQNTSREQDLGVHLALGGMFTAAIFGAGAWLYMKGGGSSENSSKSKSNANENS